MPRTIVLKEPFQKAGLDAIWSFPECVYNTTVEEYPEASALMDLYHFAERTDGSTKGDGSGPFFTATYVPPGSEPHITYDGSSHRVVNLIGTQSYQYTVWGSTYTKYVCFRPSIRNGVRILAWAEVQYDGHDRWYNNDFGYLSLSDHLINAASASGRLMGARWNDWGPYPDPSIIDSPDSVINWLLSLASDPSTRMRGSSYFYYQRADFEYGEKEEVEFNQIPFKFGEHAYYTSKAHPGFSSPFSSPGSLHPGLFSAAYYAAQDRLPQLLSNTFQNLLEAGRTVISLANGIDLADLRNIKRLAGSAWLAYRYQYNTTVGDLEELEAAIERFDDLSRMSGNLTSYAASSDSTGMYHCALVVSPESILGRGVLKNLNLRPTLANVWDMIPYSFIVDWFTGIGDVLKAIDQWLDEPSFGSVRCWYSYTNAYQTEDGGTLTCYFRYEGGVPLLPYWTMSLSSRNTTWWMRATDVVSLLT
jgi:hypothetical protein